jgi:NDP-sugar pyrophosphorylase family protein
MEFAIIAAGEGSRLKEGGFTLPKPMVTLEGLPLIHRLINVFANNGATAVHIIINEFSPEVEIYLAQLQKQSAIRINIIKKSTPSSLHSFYELLPHIKEDAVCLTTVDTVFDETEFSGYITAFLNGQNADALMAVTSFVDDEKPLYAVTNSSMDITAYLDEKSSDAHFVSGGIYCLRRKVFGVVEDAVVSGASRMRNLQRLFISEGFAVKAYAFSKIIDIDHVQDIAKAEEWLAEMKVPAQAH